jgi:L,D-transpeptidase YcbB
VAAALIIAGCASLSGNRAPMTSAVMVNSPQEITQTALRKLLQADNSGREDQSRPVNRLLAFYEARKFQATWTGSASGEHMAVEVRAALARAHEQGLRDEDYKLPPEAHPAPGTEAAQYDIALSGAALRYARDVHTGRVLPIEVYGDAEFPAAQDDIAVGLAAAAGNGQISSYFDGLPPAHPEYRRLANALMRYSAIADAGGWPIFSGKEVQLTGKDPQQSTLIKRLSFEDEDFAAIQNPPRSDIVNAVKRFQARNGLEQDGRVRGGTLTALNVSAKTRVAQIAANMERWRWLPAQFESRYVAVNVPDQSVQFVRDGTALLTSRVIVGRKTSPTPITRSAITSVVVNPPWDIPGDIAARDLLPHLKKDANYLASKHMVVTDGPAGDPYGRTINWRKIVPAEFPYAIRQLPGPEAGLGTLMLDSPNDFDVYLHDTPAKKLFAAADREISNGCVRVQQIFPLASLVLDNDAQRGMPALKQAEASHETKRLTLDNPVPVYFLYWTAIAGDDGSVEFRPDIYNRDVPLIAALNGSVVRAARKNPQAEAPPNDSLAP